MFFITFVPIYDIPSFSSENVVGKAGAKLVIVLSTSDSFYWELDYLGESNSLFASLGYPS